MFKMAESKNENRDQISERVTSASKHSGVQDEAGKQEVELVEAEARLEHLLSTIAKTKPPIVILASSKKTVEAIYEFLKTKNIDAGWIHGGKGLEDRQTEMNKFQSGEMGILITTIIALRGVYLSDFMNHIINYDAPNDIENYIHIAGCMAKSGRTTTFISKDTSLTFLKDLKEFLVESNQKVPDCLENLIKKD